MRKSKLVGVRLTPDHFAKLERLAAASGATISDAMRLLVERTDEQGKNENSRNAPTSHGERIAVAA